MIVIQSIFLVVLLIMLGLLVLIYRNSLPAYFAEKGKNLATKQDIADITREVERTRSAFLDRQLQFSHFIQKQLDVIGTTYGLLHDAQDYVVNMVQPFQYGGDEEEKARRKQAIDAFNALSGFYWKHKIYLPEHLSVKFEEVVNAIKDATLKYTIARRGGQTDHNLDLWDEAFKLMTDRVPQLRSDLEKAVHEIIAVKPVSENPDMPVAHSKGTAD
jgi:hypothetical protein